MATEVQLTGETSRTNGLRAGRLIGGLILVAPAGFCCLLGLAWPTFSTVMMSLQNVDLLRAQTEFVGLTNYTALFQDETFRQALSFTLTLSAVRVAVVAVVPLLLALLVNEFGRAVRSIVRLLFTIPLALFAPVIMALAWLMALHPSFGLLPGQEQPWLADPERAGPAIFFIDGLSTFSLACGLGLIFYLAALRGWDETAPTWVKAARPVIVIWVAGLLAALALGWQSFTLSYTLTAGGPGNTTTTLAILEYRHAFQFFRFGTAAAIATLTLGILAGLGLVVGLLVNLTGLQLAIKPSQQPPSLLRAIPRPLAVALLVLILLSSLGLCALSVWPLGWSSLNSLKTEAEIFGASSVWPTSPSLAAYTRLAETILIARALINTLLPSLLSLFLFQLPGAYLAALGIGAVRPLGRRSDWLLLPFSPWLFVTIGPLSLPAFQNLRQAELLNTFPALISPLLLNVPILFILTLFFKGQSAKFNTALAAGQSPVRAGFGHLILPSLPLVGLLAAGALLVTQQELLWPLIVANSPEYQTINVALLLLRSQFQTAWPLLAAGLTLFELPNFLFFFLVLALFQLLYLDRLVLETQPPDVKA